MRQGAQRHGTHHLATNSTVKQQGTFCHPKHLHLGRIGVGNKTAIKPGRTPGYIRDRVGNPPTGAGLCRGRHQLMGLQFSSQLPRPSFYIWIHANPLVDGTRTIMQPGHFASQPLARLLRRHKYIVLIYNKKS